MKILILQFDGLGDYFNTSAKIRQAIEEDLTNNSNSECKTLIYGEHEEPVNIRSLGVLKYNSKSLRDAETFANRALEAYKDLECEPKIIFDIHSSGAYFAAHVIEYLNETFQEQKLKENGSEENKLFCQFYNDIYRVFLNQPFISNKIKDLKSVATILAPLSFTRKTNQESYKKLLFNKKDDSQFNIMFYLCPNDTMINYNSQQSFFKGLAVYNLAVYNMVSISTKARSHTDNNTEQYNFINSLCEEKSPWDFEHMNIAKEFHQNDNFENNLLSASSRFLHPKSMSQLNKKNEALSY